MKNPPPTRADRRLRLKLRLGWRPRKFHTRIRPGRWITFPPGLGIRGDHWEIERLDNKLVLRRTDTSARRPLRRIARLERT